MLTQIARFVLRRHILKKAASLRIADRLAYLASSYRVHGVMLPVSAIFGLGSIFFAAISIFPEIEIALHMAERVFPEDRAIGLCIGGGFLISAVFWVVTIFVLLRTREMLAGLFLVNLVTCIPGKV